MRKTARSRILVLSFDRNELIRISVPVIIRNRPIIEAYKCNFFFGRVKKFITGLILMEEIVF